jgi:hypothetical protein
VPKRSTVDIIKGFSEKRSSDELYLISYGLLCTAHIAISGNDSWKMNKKFFRHLWKRLVAAGNEFRWDIFKIF